MVRFGVASNFTQFVTYEKAGEEEKEIAPLARKRLPPVKPPKEPAAAVPAAASGLQPSTPEVEKKSDGNVVGEKKERPPKREKPAAKHGAKPVDGPATAPASVPAAAAPAKPAAAVADAAHGHGQQQAGQRPPRPDHPGRQQQQRPPRDAPKTQELEATTLFRSISRMQNKCALYYSAYFFFLLFPMLSIISPSPVRFVLYLTVIMLTALFSFGAWSINRNFADVICIDINDVQGAIRTNTTPGVGRVWATVLAIAFIELYVAILACLLFWS